MKNIKKVLAYFSFLSVFLQVGPMKCEGGSDPIPIPSSKESPKIVHVENGKTSIYSADGNRLLKSSSKIDIFDELEDYFIVGQIHEGIWQNGNACLFAFPDGSDKGFSFKFDLTTACKGKFNDKVKSFNFNGNLRFDLYKNTNPGAPGDKFYNTTGDGYRLDNVIDFKSNEGYRGYDYSAVKITLNSNNHTDAYFAIHRGDDFNGQLTVSFGSQYFPSLKWKNTADIGSISLNKKDHRRLDANIAGSILVNGTAISNRFDINDNYVADSRARIFRIITHTSGRDLSLFYPCDPLVCYEKENCESPYYAANGGKIDIIRCYFSPGAKSYCGIGEIFDESIIGPEFPIMSCMNF